MKQCPQCGECYSDDFAFCSKDGSELTSHSGSSLAGYFALPFPTAIDFGFSMMMGNAIVGAISVLLALVISLVAHTSLDRVINILPFWLPFWITSILSGLISEAIYAGVICGGLFLWSVHRTKTFWHKPATGLWGIILLCVAAYAVVSPGVVYSVYDAGSFSYNVLLCLRNVLLGLAAGMATSVCVSKRDRTIYSTFVTIAIVIIFSFSLGRWSWFMPQIVGNILLGAVIGVAASIKLKVKAEA